MSRMKWDIKYQDIRDTLTRLGVVTKFTVKANSERVGLRGLQEPDCLLPDNTDDAIAPDHVDTLPGLS